ncbi:unnamed protein product [Diamesa tonsa]
MHQSLAIVFILSFTASICSQETPVPASQLPPRDYNPHPYIVPGLRSYLDSNVVAGIEDNLLTFGIAPKILKQFQNTGPIQFPVNEGAAERKIQEEEQTQNLLNNIAIKQSLLVPPYDQVTEARRNENLARIAFNADQNAAVLESLALHAQKVLSNKFQSENRITEDSNDNQLNQVDQDFVDYQEEDEIVPSATNNDFKQYRFSYAVKDHTSGDDFSHTQRQQNGAVQGNYQVQLPDGRMQIVKYTADDVNGYRADVSYESQVPYPQQRQNQNYAYSREVKDDNRYGNSAPQQYQSKQQYYNQAPTQQFIPNYNYYPSSTVAPDYY